jgi:predicted DNA-binding WGR domain protein
MTNTYQWLNPIKSRYYTITVNKHGSNHIILNYKWGGCHSNRGGTKSISVQSEEEAQNYIKSMIKRRKSRGYQLIHPEFLDSNLA